MKKTLLLVALFAFSYASAQFNSGAPWMKDFDFSDKSAKVKFQDVVDAFEAYWETRDPNVKGSGYKPFKRWESYWQNFVDEDGYLPTSTELWNIWQQTRAQRSAADAQADESNWISIGPTSFLNQSTNAANIGRVNVIIKDPNNANTYYAGAPSGSIWKSTDAGGSWTPLTDDLPQIGVSGIAIDYNDSNTIYIATGDDDAGDSFSVGVFKSTDGGTTWNETGLNPGNSPTRMNDIYIHPTNSNILWVATNNGVYKTTDAGVNWTQTQSGNIRDIKVKPGDPNTIYAVSSNNFYKSTDGGDSFSLSNSGLPPSSSRLVIDVTPANSNVVYVVSADGAQAYQGLFKSTDSGDSFTQTANNFNIFESTQAWYDLAMAVSDTDEDEVYVGVLNIWKSSNGGDSFTQLNSWFQRNQAYTHADIHFLRFYDNELYAGTDGGFFKSSDGGTTFNDHTVGMEITQFYRISVSQQTANKIAGGTQDNGGFAYVGQWSNYHGGDGMESVIDPNNDNLYYGFMQFGQNLFVSNNSGQTGSQAFSGPENGNWITPMVINSEGEVYGGYSRVYRFDGGSWTTISPWFGTNIDAMEVDPVEPDNMYVAINNTLRKSTDRGVTFDNVETFSSNITSIEVNNNDSSIVYVTTSGLGGGVFKSTDGGLTFTDISATLPSVTKNIIKHRPDDPLNTLYLGTHLGVYRYDDNLAAWEAFENNLPNTSVRDLDININDDKIVAGTYGRGIWISDLAPTQLASDDVRLVTIDEPGSNSFQCGDINPQITVKNNGQNTITSIDVTYAVDGGADSNFEWTGTLSSEDTAIIDIPMLTLPRGEHTLDVTTSITNDTFPNNNSLSITFFVNDAGVAQLINTFETVDDELITYNEGGSTPLWERGVPAGTVLNTTNSGTSVYGTNLDGNHTDQTRAFLFSQCYNLSEITNPVLKFHMAFDIEFDWDLTYVEYTLDEGANWSLLGSASDPNWYNSDRFAGDGVANNCFNCVGGQWTGTNATMTQYTYALDALTNEPNVIFRVVFHSDQSVTQEGVIIDDFYVDGTLSISDFSLNDVAVFPNPSDNIFNIKLNNISAFDLQVTDITGKIVLQQKNIAYQGVHTLQMNSFAKGIYFLSIEADGKKATKKLILK